MPKKSAKAKVKLVGILSQWYKNQYTRGSGKQRFPAGGQTNNQDVSDGKEIYILAIY